MKKQILIIGITSSILLIPFNLQGEEISSGNDNTPEWLKRTELSTVWETDQKPRFYFQTVQPLYQDVDEADTIFIQPRVSLQADEFTYNLGLGYRRLMSENWLLGANVFGDFEDQYDHGRLGVGAEIFGEVFEARANGYFGITDKRIVAETSSSITYEEVVDGFDAELGAPLPYLPWLKIYGSGFWYDFKQSEDKYGWRSRLEAKMNDALTFEFYTWDDNKGDQEYGGRFRFFLAFDDIADIKDIFTLADKPYPARDLRAMTLVPVERDFNIIVEKYADTGTMTVSIGRGT